MKNATWPVWIACLTLMFSAAGTFADTSEKTRSLSLQLVGLPADASDGKVVLKTLRVEDGTVASVVLEDAYEDQSLEIEDKHLVVVARYFGFSPRRYLEGWTGFYGQEALELSMGQAKGQSKKSSTRNLKTASLVPPQHGIAIGYNADDFVVTGLDDMPWMSRGMRDVVITDLVSNPCGSGSDNSFVVVVTADPHDRALLQAEIDLQQSPDFDPRYRVKPRWIDPTHMLHGRVTVTGDLVVATAYLTDLATGEVVATASKTGTLDQLLETVGSLGPELSRETCKEKPWRGSITIEDHDDQTFPNADPKKPGGHSKSDLSITCQVEGSDAECSVSYSSSLTGNGASLVKQATGSAKVGASAGPSGENKFAVYVGRFYVTGTTQVSMDGLSDSGPEEMLFGGWGGSGPFTPGAKTHSGSYREGTRTITWNMSRK